ncbi:MAG: exosortase H [Bacteroidetes bacterium]|nr:exosortase H [Bacteroidota bacterium]
MRSNEIKIPLTGWRKNHPVIFFVGLLALQVIAFYMIYNEPWFQGRLFNPLINVFANLSGKILNVMGQAVTVSGDTISSNLFSVGIKKGCDAAEPMALFIAGIIAFPSSIIKKLWGLLAGLTVLFFLNIIRIVSLFFVGIKYPDWFDAMHLSVWQVIFILISIALWFLWIRWSINKTTVS